MLTPTHPADATAVLDAMRALLQPLARLAVAQGVTAVSIEALLREAFIAAAREAQPPDAPTRQVSRIAAATGLTRREVSRLIGSVQAVAAPRRSVATELFARWLTDPKLKSRGGKPRSLARQGPAPSFEALAQTVTRDVHPRTLLEELCRLGLARVDDDRETVSLQRESFVPVGDTERLLGLVGHNVGDHLQAAVSNVLGADPPHLEQAVFADELSPHSVEEVRAMVRRHWQELVAQLVPALQKLIDADRAERRLQNQRVRIGMYALSTSQTPAAMPATDINDSGERRASKRARSPR